MALAGIHLEGPFINPAASGVHRRADLRPPVRGELTRLHDAARGALRVVTLAPELPGGLAAVEHLTGLGVTVSVGHSTADFAQAAAAFDAGARRVTHCFNALPPVRGREPGAVLAALLDDRVGIEVIADGRHLAAPVLDLVHRVAGPARVIAVSDGSDVAGLPDGPARRWEGTEVVLSAEGISTPDGGLAGGAHALDRAVATLCAAGVPLPDALAAASSAPAHHHGLHTKGRLEPGCDADVVVLTPALRVAATIAAGRYIHGGP
ncbi:amidohydrolase family protein [Murinocardiopsis flavida]|uniref:Amidohydrolase family protein n=1 Tax=Murinocardiopsis flavida TaxID=645275 RepID=A0A2P8DTZ0_9ACTN|nr:amidohydrolase family protein [Murinocardiopsis flavida]PSL00681.1 amidohydrolase family protein [Murinocardiopsis flavida]